MTSAQQTSPAAAAAAAADYAASMVADNPTLCAAQIAGRITDAMADDNVHQDIDWRELDDIAQAAAETALNAH